MAKMFQVYGVGQALIPVLPPPIPFENAPTSNNTNYEVGQIVFTPGPTASNFYIYAGAGNWPLFASGGGDIVAINGTANQVTVVTSAGTATVSLPSAITTPGSLTTTTTLTGGTGITATTGNVTASAGNLVSAGTGNGVVLPVTVVTAGASPQTANARAFAVTFSGVSIAAGATQSFVIDNTAVNTEALISMSGATTGAALTIQSITYSAATSITIVVQNGTGATTTTANITFTGICLN
jgi:hypothetical protein